VAVTDEVRPAGPSGTPGREGPDTPTPATLDAIANRILWLAVRMIHEANHVRPSVDGIKVGGHQASSASVVSILTALYFRWLRAGDLVAIKPHASPAYHSLQYLLGNLDASMLTRLREFGGLQSYPSRTKDPDRVDFSTGSVGLGAVAPMFAALADRYLRLHFRESIASQPASVSRRFACSRLTITGSTPGATSSPHAGSSRCKPRPISKTSPSSVQPT
jgi:pyruvate dehydrogenase E1 component